MTLLTEKRSTGLLVALGVAFVAAAFVEPMGFVSGDAWRDNDWLNTRLFDELARIAMLEHLQLGARSHMVGGGFPTLAHPSDGTFAPTLLPVLLFGTVIGTKIDVLLALLVGAFGVRALGRRVFGLSEDGAFAAAALMLCAGWLPSLLLVGFWQQIVYLLLPWVLLLLWEAEGRPDRVIGAGLLLAGVLQQGGNAIIAACWFVGLALLLLRADGFQGALRTLGAVGLGTAGLAFARGFDSPWPLGVAAALLALWFWRSPALRTSARARLPDGLRVGAAVLLAVVVMTGKIAGLFWLLEQGTYQHVDARPRAVWFPPAPPIADASKLRAEGEVQLGDPGTGALVGSGPFGGASQAPPRAVFRLPTKPPPGMAPPPDGDFWNGPGELLRGLLFSAPKVAPSVPYPVPPGAVRPIQPRPGGLAYEEYSWLGLTPLGLLLALLGAARGPRERSGLLVLAGASAGVCLGPHLLPDFHFLLVWGLPGADRFSQPLKYFSFFVLVPTVLLAGMGVQWALARVDRRLGIALLAAVALWPLLQNQAPLRHRFAEPLPEPEQRRFEQILQVGHPDWTDLSRGEIERLSRAYVLREFGRPPEATEFLNARNGVGTIDWYGTLTLPEPSVPKWFVTPSGARLENPDHQGEAWVRDGDALVAGVAWSPNAIELQLESFEEAVVVVNQAALPGFVADGGELVEHEGLLAVRVPRGATTVRLLYRPAWLLRSWAVGLLALAAALAAWLRLRRRAAT